MKIVENVIIQLYFVLENEKPPTDIVGTNGKGFVWKEDEESDNEDDDRIVHKLWGRLLLSENGEKFVEKFCKSAGFTKNRFL